MRCLYCNKRLSLLKLAKGDSFCSPDHFDQYQLQLSKNAFERLKDGAFEETPKAPLVFRAETETSEVPKPEPQAGSVQEERVEEVRTERPPQATRPRRPVSRKSITARPPVKLIHEPDPAMARVQGFSTPPEAPFAISPLAPWPPSPEAPLRDLEVAGEADAPKREVEFPVHTVEVTACILNLYLQVNLSQSAPVDWQAAQRVDATPEAFLIPAVMLPVLAIAPDFPQYEEDLEPLDFSAPAPTEIVESQESIPASEQIPEMVTDQLAPQISLELNDVAELPPAAAIVESPTPVSCAAEKPALSFASTQPVSGFPEEDEMLALPVNGGLVPAESLSSSHATGDVIPVAPKAEGKPALSFAPTQPISQLPVPDDRIPFLTAPAFRGRRGNSSPFECAAVFAPNPVMLDASFGSAKAAPAPSTSGVAQSIGHPGTVSLKLRDLRAQGIASELESQTTPVVALPLVKGGIGLRGWHDESKALPLKVPLLESARTAIQPVGYLEGTPSATITRPFSAGSLKQDGQTSGLAAHDAVLRYGLARDASCSISLAAAQPERPTPHPVLPFTPVATTPVVSASSLCLGGVRRDAPMRVPIWRDFPAQPAASSHPLTLAGISSWEAFDPGVWSRQTDAAALPASIANGTVLRAFPLHPLAYESPCRTGAAAAVETPALANTGHRPAVWKTKESRSRPAKQPENILASPALPPSQFFQPPRIGGPKKIPQGKAVRIAREYPFLPAHSAISGALAAASQSSTTLPKNEPGEIGLAQVPRCAASVTWEPQPLVSHHPPPLKFLPVRKSPILPTARSWPRLPVPPR